MAMHQAPLDRPDTADTNEPVIAQTEAVVSTATPVAAASVPFAMDEDERLAALQRYDILDSSPEPGFDRITALAAKLFSVPVSTISLVDRCRVWFKSRVGWQDAQVTREESLCSWAVLQEEVLVIHDARLDQRLRDNPFVQVEPGIRFYAGAPLITADGFNLGTLCIVDTEPREQFDEAQRQTLADLAAVVVGELELRRSHQQAAHTAVALGESEERLRLAAAAAELGIFEWDAVSDCAVWENDRMYEIFGYEQADGPIGKAQFFERVLHPDDAQDFERALSAGAKPGKLFRAVCRICRKDGEWRWVEAAGRFELGPDSSPLRLVGVLGDITHRLRSEQALLERVQLATFNSDVSTALTANGSMGDMLHRCTEAVVHHLGAAFARIWTLDETRDALVLEASSGLYTHLDGPHAVVPVGRFKIGLIAQDRKPHLTNTVIGDPQVSEQAWAAREGMVAFAGYPLVLGERLVGVIAMFARQPLNEATTEALASVAHSIALGIERKHTEAQRTALLEREQHARALAEEANRLKDEFLATLGHELRSPLNAILGWVQMLRGGRLNPAAQVNALEVVERNARAQNRLIEDLLDVSRIITGKLRLDIQPVELTAVITAALDTVRPAAEAKNIDLAIVLDPKAATVSGDPNRLQQVVWNLLSNAVKFTPKGGRVQVELSRVGSQVEIIVTDSGAGIASAVLPHVFERFRQADSSTTRIHGGLGLGLAIVRQLTESHGGSVRVDSPGLGLGATFTVRLPVRAVRHSEEEEAGVHPGVTSKLPDADDLPRLDGVRVLVVDDEADNREMVKAVLEVCGAEVATAASAGEALALLGRVPFDVLVSDIGMPEEDGYSLIRQVRLLGTSAAQTPAAALTAYARPEDRTRALLAGFQQHLSKPVEPSELTAVVASLARRIGDPGLSK